MESIGGIIVVVVVGHDTNIIDIDDYLEMNGNALRKEAASLSIIVACLLSFVGLASRRNKDYVIIGCFLIPFLRNDDSNKSWVMACHCIDR